VTRALPLLLLLSCATWWQTGSVVRSQCLHIGVRPASDGWGAVAATVQVSTDAPVCREVYRSTP
jgi:hypothetical protein